MKISQIRATTIRARGHNLSLEKLKARHTKEVRSEVRSRFLNLFRRAVELAAAEGENGALIEYIWTKDVDIIDDILKKEFKAFESSWLKDDSRSRPEPHSKCYIVRLNW